MPLHKWLVKGSPEDLRYRQYQQYLRSPEWKAKREAVLHRCNGICERCGKFPVDHVHHRTYERLRNELLTDLEGLCEVCHEAEHKEGKKTGSEVFVQQERDTEDKAIRTAGREAERVRQSERSESYSSYAGIHLTDAEVAKMFRNAPTLVYLGVPHRILKVAVSRRRTAGVDLTVIESVNTHGRYCFRFDNVQVDLRKGVILFDTERQFWSVKDGAGLHTVSMTKASLGIFKRHREAEQKASG